MKAEHTPTPWKTGGSFGLDVLTSDGNTHIANCGIYQGENEYTQGKQANAEFIVRAVNNHDALVEALNELLDTGIALARRFESHCVSDDEVEQEFIVARHKAAIALKQASEKK